VVRVLWQAASRRIAGDVDVLALQTKTAARTAAVGLEDETGESMKVWCIQIKSARSKVWMIMSVHLNLRDARILLKDMHEEWPGHSIELITARLEF
jgi:hypothetical protein